MGVVRRPGSSPGRRNTGSALAEQFVERFDHLIGSHFLVREERDEVTLGEGAEGQPVVLVRGLRWTQPESSVSALVREAQDDLFR